MDAVASSATLNPGESAHILVTFNRPMVGMRDVMIRVFSNDAIQPEQTLTLRFEVGP